MEAEFISFCLMKDDFVFFLKLEFNNNNRELKKYIMDKICFCNVF